MSQTTNSDSDPVVENIETNFNGYAKLKTYTTTDNKIQYKSARTIWDNFITDIIDYESGNSDRDIYLPTSNGKKIKAENKTAGPSKDKIQSKKDLEQIIINNNYYTSFDDDGGLHMTVIDYDNNIVKIRLTDICYCTAKVHDNITFNR